MKVQLKSTLENFHSDLWGYHIPVPLSISNKFIEGENRRVICTINGETKIQSALMPKSKNEGYYILVNKKVREQLSLEEGDQVVIELEKDNSEFGLPVPESFMVLLDQDPEGNEYFRSLTMGKQRSLIYIVGKVKNVDSQLNKGMAILEHLKEVEGRIDFKMLMAKIKEYNQMGKMK